MIGKFFTKHIKTSLLKSLLNTFLNLSIKSRDFHLINSHLDHYILKMSDNRQTGNRRSYVWDYIDEKSLNIETRKVKCRVCNESVHFDNNTTSTLIYHLRTKHNITAKTNVEMNEDSNGT